MMKTITAVTSNEGVAKVAALHLIGRNARLEVMKQEANYLITTTPEHASVFSGADCKVHDSARPWEVLTPPAPAAKSAAPFATAPANPFNKPRNPFG